MRRAFSVWFRPNQLNGNDSAGCTTAAGLFCGVRRRNDLTLISRIITKFPRPPSCSRRRLTVNKREWMRMKPKPQTEVEPIGITKKEFGFRISGFGFFVRFRFLRSLLFNIVRVYLPEDLRGWRSSAVKKMSFHPCLSVLIRGRKMIFFASLVPFCGCEICFNS